MPSLPARDAGRTAAVPRRPRSAPTADGSVRPARNALRRGRTRRRAAFRRSRIPRLEDRVAMADVTFERSRQDLRQRRPGRVRLDARRPRRRVPRPRRPVRLRQDDGAAHGRRPRGHLRRNALDRRSRRQRRDPEGARHRDGLPELRALSAPERRREHRVRPAPAQGGEGCHRRARRVGGEAARPDAVPRPQAQGALGRPAPARGDGPGDRPAAAGLPDGRAAVEPGRKAPRPDARRHRKAAARAQDDDDLRDTRPGRGDDDGRSRRRDEQGPPAAGGRAPAPLRPAREPVRRGLHRHPADESPRGQGLGERSCLDRSRRQPAADRGGGARRLSARA